MVLFLLILGWIFLESLDQSTRPNHCATCNLWELMGWTGGGAHACSLMPKLASFLLKWKKSTISGVIIAYLFVVEWVGIYKEKLRLLSLLNSDTISLPLGEEFPFPYHGQTVKG